MRRLLLTLWRGWKRALHGLNGAISAVLMSVVYWTAVAPVALVMRATQGDIMDRGLGQRGGATAWLPPRSGRQDVRRSQRPY